MHERPMVTLGAYVDILTGFPFTSRHYADNGIRLLRGDNVGQGRLRWEGAKSWPSASVADVSQYYLGPGDVVLAMDRPWIEAGLKFAPVRPTDLPCLLVQRVARLRAKHGLDQAFLQFLIGSSAFVNHVLAVQTGSAVPHISAAQIREFEFRLPDLAEQRMVAEVLGALDNKIDANARLVRLCDDLWLALTTEALDDAAVSGGTVPLTSAWRHSSTVGRSRREPPVRGVWLFASPS